MSHSNNVDFKSSEDLFLNPLKPAGTNKVESGQTGAKVIRESIENKPALVSFLDSKLLARHY